MGKASSIKDRRNVLAVKSVKTMPCKARGEKKKKKTLRKTEEIFAKRPILWAWPTWDFFFFLSSLSKHRKFTEWGVRTNAK